MKYLCVFTLFFLAACIQSQNSNTRDKVLLPRNKTPAATQNSTSHPSKGGPSKELRFENAKKVLAQHCFECHVKRAPKFNEATSEEAYLQIKNSDDEALVVAKTLSESRIWLRMNDADEPMPPARIVVRPTSEELDTIRDWILGLGDP